MASQMSRVDLDTLALFVKHTDFAGARLEGGIHAASCVLSLSMYATHFSPYVGVRPARLSATN